MSVQQGMEVNQVVLRDDGPASCQPGPQLELQLEHRRTVIDLVHG